MHRALTTDAARQEATLSSCTSGALKWLQWKCSTLLMVLEVQELHPGVLKFSEEPMKKPRRLLYATRIRQKHCSATLNRKKSCEGNGRAEQPLHRAAHCGSTAFTHHRRHTQLCMYFCLPNHELKYLLSVWNRSKPPHLGQPKRCRRALTTSPWVFPTSTRPRREGSSLLANIGMQKGEA